MGILLAVAILLNHLADYAPHGLHISRGPSAMHFLVLSYMLAAQKLLYYVIMVILSSH